VLKGYRSAPAMEYHFLDFRLLPGQVRLIKAGQDVALAPKTFHFLCLMLGAGNAVVSRDRLFEQLWQGRAVSDESLAQVVAQCRRALDDSAARQRIIKTIPKLGYRLIPEITVYYPDTVDACWIMNGPVPGN